MNQAASLLHFPSGKTMQNRFLLAPMTNCQSHDDGRLSEDELHWLSMRAKGGFGMVMTCASHVHPLGKGFPGQLGIFDDIHIPGHQKIVDNVHKEGHLAVIQLHHAGMRSPKELIGEAPICPSINEKTGARAISQQEIKNLIQDFIKAAKRAKNSGYDGVEIHGAHGYILCQFISSEINHRTDNYGGSLENRSRIIFEIIEGIRKVCGNNFIIGLRLSPERFGMDIDEIKTLCKKLINRNQIDFIDISLWDVFKIPEEEKYQNKSLLAHFTEIDYKEVKLTVAGKIQSSKDVIKVLDSGVDFVGIGRSGILHHDFPNLVINDPSFKTRETPVSSTYLRNEGIGTAFIDYMKRWPNFVLDA